MRRNGRIYGGTSTLKRYEDNSVNTSSETYQLVERWWKMIVLCALWHIFFVDAANCCVRNGTSATDALRRKFRWCAVRNPHLVFVKMINDESPSYTALHDMFFYSCEMLLVQNGVFAHNFQQHSPRNASFAAGCMDHPTGFRLAAERCQNFRLSAAFLHIEYFCFWHGLQ